MTGDSFAAGMSRMAAMWPRSAPAATTAAVYYDALADLSDDVWAAAVTQCLRDCTFYPVPAEIRQRADDLLTASGWLPEPPEAAWARVMAAVRRFIPGQPSDGTTLPEPHLSVVRQVGGLYLIATAADDFTVQQTRQEFLSLYAAKRRRMVNAPTAFNQRLAGLPSPLALQRGTR